MSLTEALRAGAPQAFGALYDEYAGALYAYCHVMVGDEAPDALRDAFVTVARDPDAAPADDAGLPVWLHSLARAECVRRGALVRGVVTTRSADPLRHVLALLTPAHREILALSNALDPEQTAQVLGVDQDTADTLVREAQQRLEEAAASVGGQDAPGSAMLAPLSGEALRRLVTLGHEPPARQREWVLSAAAGGALGGASVFDTDGTPLPPDAFAAQADDATHQFPSVSSEEPETAPLHRVEETSPDVRPDQPLPAAGLPVGLGAVAWESEEPDAEQPPPVHATHAKPRKPFTARRLLPVAILAACVVAAAGTALAWPNAHHANETGASVRQSAPPNPPPASDETSPTPQTATSGPSPTPTKTASPTSPTPSDDPTSATRPSSKKPSRTPVPAPPPPPTTRPKPHHTTTRSDAPGGRPSPHHPGRTCHGNSFRCTHPRPWHSAKRPRPRPGDRPGSTGSPATPA